MATPVGPLLFLCGGVVITLFVTGSIKQEHTHLQLREAPLALSDEEALALYNQLGDLLCGYVPPPVTSREDVRNIIRSIRMGFHTPTIFAPGMTVRYMHAGHAYVVRLLVAVPEGTSPMEVCAQAGVVFAAKDYDLRAPWEEKVRSDCFLIKRLQRRKSKKEYGLIRLSRLHTDRGGEVVVVK